MPRSGFQQVPSLLFVAWMLVCPNRTTAANVTFHVSPSDTLETAPRMELPSWSTATLHVLAVAGEEACLDAVEFGIFGLSLADGALLANTTWPQEPVVSLVEDASYSLGFGSTPVHLLPGVPRTIAVLTVLATETLTETTVRVGAASSSSTQGLAAAVRNCGDTGLKVADSGPGTVLSSTEQPEALMLPDSAPVTIDSGVLFVGGTYLSPPYTLERAGGWLFVNDVDLAATVGARTPDSHLPADTIALPEETACKDALEAYLLARARGQSRDDSIESATEALRAHAIVLRVEPYENGIILWYVDGDYDFMELPEAPRRVEELASDHESRAPSPYDDLELITSALSKGLTVLYGNGYVVYSADMSETEEMRLRIGSSILELDGFVERLPNAARDDCRSPMTPVLRQDLRR